MKKVKINPAGHNLSCVKESDLIDIEGLLRDISVNKKKVWFWVADQLGRGEYNDAVIGNHYIDAGASYALDNANRVNNEIWASGKTDVYINNHIKKSDYLFIISGSPLKSKMFNKRVFELFAKRVGNFDAFKRDVLTVCKVKGIIDILIGINSFDELKESPLRKTLLNAIEEQRNKKTALRDVLIQYNAFIDYNSLRDGFYADNDFKQNDIMLVLKPSVGGGKANHSTYETKVSGEVVGVPDKKINAYNLLIDSMKKQYDLALNQQSQVVAPYGSAVREIEYV